ncbi:DeoR/GlpR family DNA-binding transcription regulator [Thermaerobacter composti]|uniref:DeoR/GlpR family DNA-binding transcription regulator n=1 Tax=Thermaerobacter composti TaxID=554949 RepID=A0ABZ0QLZ1_9FIRM|nr:DeoR/GlpR family DNA-binding transcription regulator [Thermaerobacter composti]WPD18259.1 DeoR/GlpR family DNA-binding transcription regulator [Thermaerobacter composti]
MSRNEREQAILQHLGTSRYATVAELSAVLGVSEVTVRRYLDRLENEGLVTRTHGGALLTSSLMEEPEIAAKEALQAEEKRRIAEAAASMIGDGDAIALNAGTTTAAIARLLRNRNGLTVVTNSMSVVNALATCPGIRLVVTGGQLRERSLALVGPLAVRSLEGVYVNKVFLGVNGLSLKYGLTTPNMDEATVNQAMLQSARMAIVVADHTKFGKVTFSRIATVQDIDVVITDDKAPAKDVERLRSMGKEVIVV